MSLFRDKYRKQNSYFDNYMEKYFDLFKLGLFTVLVALICYGVYETYKYLFIWPYLSLIFQPSNNVL